MWLLLKRHLGFTKTQKCVLLNGFFIFRNMFANSFLKPQPCGPIQPTTPHSGNPIRTNLQRFLPTREASQPHAKTVHFDSSSMFLRLWPRSQLARWNYGNVSVVTRVSDEDCDHNVGDDMPPICKFEYARLQNLLQLP